MADSITDIAAMITPEVWRQYKYEEYVPVNALANSGILTYDPNFALPTGGLSINLPWFLSIEGTKPQDLSEGDITFNALSTEKQVAVLSGFMTGWKNTALAKVVAGSPDPMTALMNYMANWLDEVKQGRLVSILGAYCGCSTMSNHRIGDSTTVLDGDMFLDAKQLLGDRKNRLGLIIMHSAVETDLLKRDEIQYVPQSEGMTDMPYYKGTPVIVDDSLPYDATSKTYKTYLLAKSTVYYDDDSIDTEGGNKPFEFQRDITAGVYKITTRHRNIMHPVGASFIGDIASDTGFATLAELSDSANWKMSYKDKNVPIVEITSILGNSGASQVKVIS